jgi:glycosyltransferase involved in cell wall biosynthesis
VLNTFLKATSLWADYIIIADQGSTDGSREIALSYPKVILVDNNNKEMQQSHARKLLFDEVCKIKGPKIIFALDADEFLSGDFLNSEGWRKIINSKVGDTFFFKWINLCYPPSKCILTDKWMFWAANMDDLFSDTTFEDSYIHEWRLPYPKSNIREIFIEDISFIHFSIMQKPPLYGGGFYKIYC